jgi:hypothetical protein
MPENLLRDSWSNLDQADLRLLFQERIHPGYRGQYDADENVIHLPFAREQCWISLIYKGARIIAIEPGPAFDRQKWDQICAEIEGPIQNGPRKIGREISFSVHRVDGWWRGEQSRVQILPPPEGAPLTNEGADNPFVLEFPIQDAGVWPTTNYHITNQRRGREHQKLTRLLNLLLIGTTKFLGERRRNFWANVHPGGEWKFEWVQEFYFADFGQIVDQELSPVGKELEVLTSDSYYKGVIGLDGRGLRVPDDLDESICRYQSLPAALQAKFDRAAYWLSMASRQWEGSMSASYASLVSAAEALTPEDATKHPVYCDMCKKKDLTHDVPGATEKFRSLFEKYTPDPGLRGRRSKMYGLRSKILHGSDLMQLDQGCAFGWDPPWWNEREMNTELWGLIRTAARNWLKEPT